jgi:hypothetical protein
MGDDRRDRRGALLGGGRCCLLAPLAGPRWLIGTSSIGGAKASECSGSDQGEGVKC